MSGRGKGGKKATGFRFPYLRTTEQIWSWVENNRDHVYERDSRGNTLLHHAVDWEDLDFVIWVVDEKGVEVDAWNNQGQTALFYARDDGFEIVSFLIDRGADPTVKDNIRRTPLINFCDRGGPVKRLLEDPRVVASINVQTTDRLYVLMARTSALHVLCYPHSSGFDPKIVELLILNGANPLLRDGKGHTALDVLPEANHYNDTNDTIIALSDFMCEAERIDLLGKAWHISDAHHAITKAKNSAHKERLTPSGTMQKVLAKTPSFLKARVEKGEVELPLVELVQPAEEGEEESEKKKEVLMGILKYVLGDEGEHGDAGRMVGDIFVELIDMMPLKYNLNHGGSDSEDEDED